MQAEHWVVFKVELKVQLVQFGVAKLQEMHAFTSFSVNVATQSLQSTDKVVLL